DGGVSYLDHLRAGRGTYKVLRDSTKPATAVTVATGVYSALISPDLRFSLLETMVDPRNGTTDAIIIKNDGTGRCALQAGTTTDLYGGAFLAHSGLAFWADHINPATGIGEGWLANPDGCAGPRKFADAIDFWFPVGDDGLVS